MAFAQSTRPIPGAVATLGVSDRVTFLRKTYAHLTVALIGFALVTGGMLRFTPETSFSFSRWALTGRWNWFLVLGLFMLTGYVADRLARSDTSRGLQYLGLAIAVVAEGILLQPMMWLVMAKFGDVTTQMAIGAGLMGHTEAIRNTVMGGLAGKIILESVGITLTIFIGLSATVFISKKDFSFMRGALTVATFGALAVIVCSMIFGFQLGAIFSGLMIILMAGYILYQTSQVMSHFPPSGYVAASLMLFSTIATLFWYVLRLMMEMNRR